MQCFQEPCVAQRLFMKFVFERLDSNQLLVTYGGQLIFINRYMHFSFSVHVSIKTVSLVFVIGLARGDMMMHVDDMCNKAFLGVEFCHVKISPGTRHWAGSGQSLAMM